MTNGHAGPDLTGRVALVTGASRGIGRATAIAFSRAGASVALVARTAASTSAAAAVCERFGGPVWANVVDVADAPSVQDMVRDVEVALGPIDTIINNAGVLGPLGPLEYADPSAWVQTLAINLAGPFLCVRFALPGMLKRHRGWIINVSSSSAENAAPYRSAYSASKAGLNHLTRVLAEEVRGSGVRVLALYPGPTDSEMMVRLREAGPDVLGEAESRLFQNLHDSHQLAAPERAAACIVALVGPAGESISGPLVDLRDSRLREQLLRGAA